MIHKDFMYHLRLTFRMNPLPLPDSGFIIRLPYVGYTMRGGLARSFESRTPHIFLLSPRKIMALYQLTFCYPYLKEYAVTVRHIRDEVEALSGNDWRVVTSGEHVCAIVFETNVEPEQLVSTLGIYGSDNFQFLLTEIAVAVAGYLPPDVWEWVDSRFPRTLKLL